MKRREFLHAAAGLASVGTSLKAFSAAPCPPPRLSASGGTSVDTACGDKAADWLARSTGPGVVWAQRFKTAADLDAWRYSSGATGFSIDATDGILGDGCLRVDTPAGGTSVGAVGRPLAPITGDVNKAGLAVLPAFSSPSARFNNMKGGVFAHSSYVNDARWPGLVTRGGDFYIQYRVRYSRNRFNANEPAGKSVMLVTNYQTPNQELVTDFITRDNSSGFYFMYTNFGNSWNSFLNGVQNDQINSTWQPGGNYDATCRYPNLGNAYNNCWCYPVDDWCTILVHVIPGRQYRTANLSDPQNPNDTGIEVWGAWPGQTQYTPIMRKLNYQWDFSDPDSAHYIDGSAIPYGWSWFQFTAYTGGNVAVPSVAGYYHKYDQVICSTQMIPCPQA